MSHHAPAGWHADPFRRFQHRYWDGTRWTEHVATNGRQWVDAPVPAEAPGSAGPAESRSLPTSASHHHGYPTPSPSASNRPVAKVEKQLQHAGVAYPVGQADHALLHEPVLVINQKGKLVELRAEFAVYDQMGGQLAAVRGKRVSSRMQVVDLQGRLLLDLRREISLLGPKFTLTGSNGEKIGRIVPSMNLNKVDRNFKLEGAENQLVGEVRTEDRNRRRHRNFSIQDRDGGLVADISKTRAGVAKELLTKGDHYVLAFTSPATPVTLRALSIATTLIVDYAYHQH